MRGAVRRALLIALLATPAAAADLGPPPKAPPPTVVVRPMAVDSVVDDVYVRSGCPQDPDCIAPRVADTDHGRPVLYRAVPARVDPRYGWKYQ